MSRLANPAGPGNNAGVSQNFNIISFQSPQSGQPGEVIGIDVAILNFARNYCRYTRQDQINVACSDDASYQRFLSLADEAGVAADRVRRLSGYEGDYLMMHGGQTLFQPDPNAANWYWHRARTHATKSYAVCSLVHTVTGSLTAGVLTDYLVAPSQVGDALICPSHAIKKAVGRHIEMYADYMNHRFGLTGESKLTCPVDFPVIPLAIEVERYVDRASPDKRAAQRAALNIADDEVAILFFGRLSYYTKSHPLPLLLAVEQAARKLREKDPTKKLRLILMGFFSPPYLLEEYVALIREFCLTVVVDIVDKDDPRFPDGLWAAADIFTSLVDNYQESFGLTPIEAMAAGLPSVITDWDGYRDSVRHGVDGFQIPTLAPPPGSGQQIAWLTMNGGLEYGPSLAASMQSVAVDIDMAAAAFLLLATDPERRRRMGESARQRARDIYDWSKIIPRYEELWDEMYQKRTRFAAPALPAEWPGTHRAFPDPYSMFDSFPTRHIADSDIVVLAADAQQIERRLFHKMNRIIPGMLMQLPYAIQLLVWLGGQPQSTVAIMNDAAKQLESGLSRETYMRTVGWLAKLGLIRVMPATL